MADKKFIVKNGLQTQNNVVVGTTTDDGTNKLQVTGPSKLSGQLTVQQSTGSTPSIDIFNDAGLLNNPIVARFRGEAQDAMEIQYISAGDYKLTNTGQDNSIIFYDGTPGIQILYNDIVDLEFDSGGIDFKREPTYLGNVFWNAGNDGTGSGLDADLLDGLDSTQFVRSDTDDTLDGDYIITGNLTINGTTTTVNTETVLIADNILTLNSNFTTGTPSENAGWEVLRGDELTSSLQWDETNDYFKLISDGTDLGRIITTADEGANNGFDADTVDGLEAEQFLRSDADDTATGNITIEGSLTIGDNVGGARINLDGTGTNGVLYSNNGVVGFLKPDQNYGAQLNTNFDWVVDNNIVAKQFVDADDNTYLVDPASGSVLASISIDDYVSHNGDLNSYFGFDADDSWVLYLNGVKQIDVSTTGTEITGTITSTGDAIAPRFVDADDNSYFVDPAGDSVLHDVGIDQKIFHNGNTNTFMNFGSNTVSFDTGGATRFALSNNDAEFTLPVYAPIYYDRDAITYYLHPGDESVLHSIGLDDDLFHNGDTDTKLSFGTNTINLDTGGVTRLEIANTAVTASVDVVAPRFVDSDNNAYLVDPAGTSVLNTVGIDSDLFHNGDTDTKLSFGTDQIDLSTGGAVRVEITDAATTFTNNVIINDYIKHNGDPDTYFGYDSDDNFELVVGGVKTLDSSSTALQTGVSFGINVAPTSPLSIKQTSTMGPNPFASTNRYVDFSDGDTTDLSIRGDQFRNIYNVMEGDAGFYIIDSSANFTLSADTSTGDVIVGDQTAQYTQGDMTPLVGANTDNKLHVNGSVQLNSDNDAYVVGNGTASFFKNNELGFGQGGGFYMTDANDVKVRNGKNISTAGNMYAEIYYDYTDTAYKGEFAGTSVMNQIELDDYIIHKGDTNNYFGFDAADQQVFYTGGTRRAVINNTYAQIDHEIRAPIFKDSADTDYSWNPNTNSAHRFSTPTGRVDIGPMDATYSHFDTDRARFFFNKPTYHDGGAYAYDATSYAYFPIYYDYDDNDYYGDFAGKSVMHQIEFDTETPTAPTTTDATTGARLILYPIGSGRDYSIGIESDHMWFNSDVGYKFYTDGANHTVINADRISHTGEMRAPKFVDSNNISYFGDFASTSRMNVVHLNQIQMDQTSYIIDSPSGEYGTIMVQGGKGGYAGYAIENDWVFMSDSLSNMGLYNDTDNEWVLYADRNSWTRLYGNGVHQISAEVGYALAPVQMRSPIYYDSDDTAYRGDFNAKSRMNQLALGNQGDYIGGSYPLGIWHNNRYLAGLRNSALSFANNGNYPWLVHDNYNSGSGDRDAFIIHFNGIGDRARINEDGDMLIDGEMAASNYNLNAGNENISLNPVYGPGMAETMVFDGTEYWEKRAIKALQGAENGPTTATSEYVKNGNGPFSASYALRTSGYRDFYSDYIPVEPGEEIYGEISVRTISGSGGVVYYGIERFDKDKKPITSNTGTTYFVASNQNQTSTSWQTYRGYTTIPTSHTVYDGSDGAGCKYIRIRLLMNYSTGGALREYGPPILKRSNIQNRIRTPDSIYAASMIDSDNNSYYVDPSSTSKMNIVDASNFRDTDNTAYFMNPASGGKVAGSWDWTNGSIENLNNLSFNDPGPQEGIRWKGGNDWKIYESPNDLTTNTGGNLHFTTGTGAGTSRFRIESDGDTFTGRYSHAQRFVDADDGNYYVDPNSSSVLHNVEIRNYGLKLNRAYTHNSIWFNGGTDSNHVLWNDYYGGPGARGAAATGFDGMYWNTYRGLHLRGGSSGSHNIIVAQNDGSNGNTNKIKLYAHNVVQLETRAGYAIAPTQFRSPIFYDSDNTDYYGDFASTSRMNVIRVNQIQLDGSEYIIDSPSGEYGSIRVEGDKTSTWAGYAIRDDWVFMSNGSGEAGIYNDTRNEWMTRWFDNGRTELYYNGQWEEQSASGYMLARGSYRAPIFYDQDNTGYYANMASTSVFNNLTLNGALSTASTATFNGIMYIDNVLDYDATVVTSLTNAPISTRNRDTNVGTTDTFLPLIHTTALYNSGYRTHMNVGLYKRASGWGDNDTGMYVALGGNDSYPTKHWKLTYGHRLYNSDGYVSQNGSFRAPIFYDLDNTGYYGNFASTSRMNQINVNTTYHVSGGIAHFQTSTGSTRGYIQATETNDAHLIIATSGGEDISFRDGGVGGAWNVIMRGDGQTLFNSRIDTPIMYDRNDTGYYVDPASTTRMNVVRGNYFTNDGSVTSDDGFGMYWDSGRSTAYAIYREAGGWSNPYPDVRIAFHTGIKFGANSGYQGMRFYDDYTMATQVMSVNNGSDPLGGNNVYVNNSLQAGSSLRAPIFYDSNNTGYFVNPNATSEMVTIRADRLDMRDRGDFITFYGNDSDNHSITSRDSSGGISDDLRFNSYHNFYFNADSNNNNGNEAGIYLGQHGAGAGAITNTWVFQARNDGVTQASGSLRAPIFYDSNNTGYYCDPSDFSNFNTGVRANEFYARNWFRNDNSGEGLYNQATGQHFYSDDDDYWNIGGGSAANGIRFRDEYGGTTRGYVYANNGNNIGFLNNGGSWRFRIVSADYGLFEGSSARGQLWYDSNDTFGMFNGGSTNSTRFRGVDYQTMSYLSMPGHTRDSGEYYRARIRITSNSDYWTGAMGWGTQDMTTAVADWGSGFIDSWSNPGNQPSGTSHWVGVQAYHYSNGSNRYGWQMVGGPITNLRFRSTWGSSFRSWRTIPVLDENSTNGGSMYAGRYYDSNDSAYYGDFASTSRFNSILINFLEFNDGWDLYDDDGDTFNIRSNNDDHGEIYYRDSNGTACGRHYWDDDGSIFSMYHDNGEAIIYADEDYITYIYYNGTWEGRTRSGYFEARGSFRAPIFYDQNDTTYYTDPASTSRMNGINANIYSMNDGWDIYDDDSNTMSIRSNNDDNGEIYYRDSNGTACGRHYWDDDGSIFSMYHDNGEAIIYADEDYITYIYYNGTWEGRTRSSYFEARSSFRGPIFYDINDTTYYTNPAGTSLMNGINSYGAIQCDENITAYVDFSDIRYKEDIEVIDNAVEKVMSLDGITYKYIDRDGRHTGVIAQQVEKVLPGIVYEIDTLDPNDAGGGKRKAVNYGNMVGLLIESTKEQQETINKQQKQIDEQKKAIDKLTEMVTMLMSNKE